MIKLFIAPLFLTLLLSCGSGTESDKDNTQANSPDIKQGSIEDLGEFKHIVLNKAPDTSLYPDKVFDYCIRRTVKENPAGFSKVAKYLESITYISIGKWKAPPKETITHISPAITEEDIVKWTSARHPPVSDEVIHLVGFWEGLDVEGNTVKLEGADITSGNTWTAEGGHKKVIMGYPRLCPWEYSQEVCEEFPHSCENEKAVKRSHQ